MLAERRAKAFAAGTIRGATAQSADQAARFYAGECAKVLQAYFHAAALAERDPGRRPDVGRQPAPAPGPRRSCAPTRDAAPLWDGLLRGALYGDERTAGNTITTVQQAMALFFQRSIRRRCVPSPARPATDLEALIRAGGTIYLLGRDDPYASASPLMTAVTEDVLDTAKRLGETSPHGRLCPPFLACLDELPSTAPIPTLSTRMANERALGLSFILAAQTWRQLVVCYGEDEARTIFGPQQQPGRLRWRQGHPLLPRALRPDRRRRHPPLRLQPRPDRPDPQLASHRHPDPATRRRPPDPATTGAAHLREQPGLPGPPTPLRRGTTRPSTRGPAARRPHSSPHSRQHIRPRRRARPTHTGSRDARHEPEPCRWLTATTTATHDFGAPMVTPYPQPGPALIRVMARLQLAATRPPTEDERRHRAHEPAAPVGPRPPAPASSAPSSGAGSTTSPPGSTPSTCGTSTGRAFRSAGRTTPTSSTTSPSSRAPASSPP